MKVRYILFDDVLRSDITALHDREKQAAFLDKRGIEYRHFELVTRYTYDDTRHEKYHCGHIMMYNWDFCPYCGDEITSGFSVADDSISAIKEYFAKRCGRPMRAEEDAKITSSVWIKVWGTDDAK